MGLLYWLPPLLASILGIHWIIKNAKQATKARRMGCKPAPVFRAWDIFGVQNFQIELNGMKTKRLSNAFSSRKNEMSDKTGRNCKTFRIYYPPGETWYYTFDPRNLQTVLATRFEDFQQPAARVGAFEPLLGLGIFSANGPTWQHSRALMKPQFMREQVADLDLFENHAKVLIDALPPKRSQGWTTTFDLQPFLERFTMDVATEFSFGESVHSQREDDKATSTLFTRKEMMQFVDAFFKAEATTAHSMIYGDLFWLLHDRKFKEQCTVVHKFVDTYVERYLRDDGLGKRSKAGKYVLLHALIEDVKDKEQLRSQLLNILIAGSDTISGTLGFFFATMAKQPTVLAKLRKAILDDFGTFEEPKQITLSGLKSCSYLQWVLNEVLRMYPIVPVNFREAVRDTSLPTGGGADGTSPVFIPKGHLVAWELWTMHSDPEFWGPDASQFNPDRWSKRKFGFDYLPFNGGPRICLGQQFALTEVSYVVVRMLQKFDNIDGSALPDGRLLCDWKLVDKVAGGVNIRFHQAGSPGT